MENTFTIDTIQIVITNITPNKVNEEQNNKVLDIKVNYEINININEPLKFCFESIINIENLQFEEFIPIQELAKSRFYPIAIEQANQNEEILKCVKKGRYLLGLEVEPLPSQKPRPTQTFTFI